MDEATKQKLRDAGREDLITAHEITQSGFAGIAETGMIVDRRLNPTATAIQANRLLNVPAPAKVKKRKLNKS